MAAAVDDYYITTTRSKRARDEHDAVAPGGHTGLPQASLGLEQGLADRVLEQEAGLRNELPTDDGDVARGGPVGADDVLRDVARRSADQRHPGQPPALEAGPPVLIPDEGLSTV
jgi:hypothetical protein